MGAWEALLAGPRGDFPRGPAPGPALPVRPWIVVLLLLACLVPRLVAAWNWDVIWGDSLHYRYASIALEQGDFEHGFAEFGLNIYPLLLIPLRHLGIDWQIAGKYFGVLVASLTVVPLWGWLRRLFDDRLAMIACLVYALQGKLIAISPLIIRDSTFWLLLVLTLYCIWRAVGELRIGLLPGRRRCPHARRPHADRGLAAADSPAGLVGVPLVHGDQQRPHREQSPSAAPCEATVAALDVVPGWERSVCAWSLASCFAWP